MPSGPASARGVAPELQETGWEVRHEKESGTKYWHDERSGRTSWSAPDGSTLAVASSAQGHEILPPTGPRLAGHRRPSFAAPVETPPPDLSQETERERLRRLGREKEAERELNKHVLNRPLSRTTASRPARARPPPGDAYDPPLPSNHRSRSRSPGRPSTSARISPPSPQQQQLPRPPFQPHAPSRPNTSSFLGSSYLANRTAGAGVDVNYVAGGAMRKWGASAAEVSNGRPSATSSAPPDDRAADTPQPPDRQQRLDERIALRDRDRLSPGGRRELDERTGPKTDTSSGGRELDGRDARDRHARGGRDRIDARDEREPHIPAGGREPRARDGGEPETRQGAGDRAINRELPPHLLAPPPPPAPARSTSTDRRYDEGTRHVRPHLSRLNGVRQPRRKADALLSAFPAPPRQAVRGRPPAQARAPVAVAAAASRVAGQADARRPAGQRARHPPLAAGTRPARRHRQCARRPPLAAGTRPARRRRQCARRTPLTARARRALGTTRGGRGRARRSASVRPTDRLFRAPGRRVGPPCRRRCRERVQGGEQGLGRWLGPEGRTLGLVAGRRAPRIHDTLPSPPLPRRICAA